MSKCKTVRLRGRSSVHRKNEQTEESEAELVANPTPEQEFVGSIINGLRSGYNPLTNSWALDEIRDRKSLAYHH